MQALVYRWRDKLRQLSVRPQRLTSVIIVTVPAFPVCSRIGPCGAMVHPTNLWSLSFCLSVSFFVLGTLLMSSHLFLVSYGSGINM